MSYYETLYTGGDSNSGSQWMSVYLYPWSTYQKNACETGGIAADAIRQAADELVSFGAVDYYEILRFKAENYNYPEWGDIDGYTYDEIEDNFRDYLDDTTSNSDSDVPNNGTGDNLYDQVGVHQLIHGGYTGCDETANGYAPVGAGAEHWGDSAFLEGRVAWSPVCSDSGLTRNAAIQECTHMFCHPDYDDTWTGEIDYTEDQHTLGKVNSSYDVTPMLTYHWDDNITYRGDCPSYSSDPTASGHEQSMTYCTKAAIRKTADELIPDNL
jgi:hypothetical protein